MAMGMEMMKQMGSIASTQVQQATEKSTEVSCQGCGYHLQKGAKFCPECGMKVSESVSKKFCSECGNKVAQGAKFCNECGFKLN